jgi:3',5'-cyclic AMP phosphodiesterase CpdA
MPLGDTQYETGNAQDYATAYDKSWGRFLDITYPVVGNHEYLTPGAAGYFGYFAGRTRAPGWYAFNKNGWRMYVLNTECGKVDCGRQKSWLVAQLAANAGNCQALVMHRPRYSSGKHGSSDHSKRFWAVAYQEHFELALAGHDHDYERFAKMDHEGRRLADGIRSFVVGTGGKSLGAFRATPVPGSVVRYNNNHGALFLDLRPNGYSWRFTTIGGKVIDAGSDNCVA